MSDEVVILRWPEQSSEAALLNFRELPRLLLVKPGEPPPPGTSCLQDWIRLPTDDADMRARLEALADRARTHLALPHLDEYGQLTFRSRRVFLSPIETGIAQTLIESFGRPVPDEALLAGGWPHGAGTPTALRVHIHRLRGRVKPLDLEIRTITKLGRVLREAAQ